MFLSEKQKEFVTLLPLMFLFLICPNPQNYYGTLEER